MSDHSPFSAADRSGVAANLVSYLDVAAQSLAGMKHYAAATLVSCAAPGLLLDLGCGGGHDLALATLHGRQCVGIDPSAQLLEAAAARSNLLIQGAGERLPFADDTFAGCHIERVLQHVEDPRSVVLEATRVVAASGLIAAFEPDWSSLELPTRGERAPAWLRPVRHPSVGRDLEALLTDAGSMITDVVTERSHNRSLDIFLRKTGLIMAVERAIVASRVARRDADLWLQTLVDADRAGHFEATNMKFLVVAEVP